MSDRLVSNAGPVAAGERALGADNSLVGGFYEGAAKTGREYDASSPTAWLQLDIYALAAVDVWHKDPADLTVTYLFLKGPTEWSRAVEYIDAIRERVRSALRGIEGAAYEPEPGPSCRHCDFRSFCEPGTAWVTQNAVSRAD